MQKKILLIQGILLVAIALLALSPATLLAQATKTIDVKGVVVDEGGEPLP